MALPAQVQKQTEAVRQLYEDINSPEDGSVDDPVELVADGAPEPVIKSAADEPVAGSQDDFEQRYRTLQGMYNAEVPRLTAQINESNQRLGQMEQLIASMQVRAPVAQAQPAPQSVLTEDEVEEYGESIDIMRKVFQEASTKDQERIGQLENALRQLHGQIVPRVEQLATNQAQSADQNFWAALSRTVPDWREVNADPRFQDWLLQVDSLSGNSRQVYLENAQQSLDADRVAYFFASWAEENGTAAEARNNRPAAASELERQVVPGRSRNTGAPTGNQLKTYTPKDIADFFADVRMGKYKGREEDRGKIERDIFAAQRDGRIVNA